MDIKDIIEDKLNGSSDSLRFKVFDMLHYHDTAIIDDGYEVIQCILGEMTGSYLPLFGSNIEDKSRVLKILFPLDKKDELDEALKAFKTSLVGSYFRNEDTVHVFNMDVPVFSRIAQQTLREFSAEDGRFRFKSEPYGIYDIRVYYKEVKSVSMGNAFIFELDGCTLPIIGLSASSSRGVTSYQFIGRTSINSYPNANAVSYEISALVDLNIDPLARIVKQALSGGVLGTYSGVLKISINDEVLFEDKVICSTAQVLMNKGDLATISFSLIRGPLEVNK